jgi:hypothetical protein
VPVIVLIVGFEKPIIDVIKVFAENLSRRLNAERNGLGGAWAPSLFPAGHFRC